MDRGTKDSEIPWLRYFRSSLLEFLKGDIEGIYNKKNDRINVNLETSKEVLYDLFSK